MTRLELALLMLIEATIEKWDAENAATHWPGPHAAELRARLVQAKDLIAPGEPT